MTGQEITGDCLIEVIAWAGLTVYLYTSTFLSTLYLHNRPKLADNLFFNLLILLICLFPVKNIKIVHKQYKYLLYH